MSTEESEIYEFLKQCTHRHVPVDEILQRASPGKEFSHDRNWMQAILRRMEIEGWVEANPQGEYRLKSRPEETTSFKKALETPGVPLGDTTIIALQDVSGEQAEAV